MFHLRSFQEKNDEDVFGAVRFEESLSGCGVYVPFVFTFPTKKEEEVILLPRPANDHCPSGATAEPLCVSPDNIYSSEGKTPACQGALWCMLNYLLSHKLL